MAILKHQLLAEPTVGYGLANSVASTVNFNHVSGLRYSSPRPWILAITISLLMWASLASLVWAYVR